VKKEIGGHSQNADGPEETFDHFNHSFISTIKKSRESSPLIFPAFSPARTEAAAKLAAACFDYRYIVSARGIL